MASINPYLNFAGNCEEAFEYYKTIFGGELELNRFAEFPGEEQPAEVANLVMHVSLPVGEGQVLMGSDRPPAMGPINVGNNIQVSVAPDTSESARRIFDGLSVGGEVALPFEKTFWGAEFGMCTDKFGIDWMVNYDLGEAG